MSPAVVWIIAVGCPADVPGCALVEEGAAVAVLFFEVGGPFPVLLDMVWPAAASVNMSTINRERWSMNIS